LNNLKSKINLKKLNYKNLFKRKGGLITKNIIKNIKSRNNNYKTIDNTFTNKNKKNETKYMNISGENSFNNYEYSNLKFMKMVNTINHNRNNLPSIERLKYMKDNNLSSNSINVDNSFNFDSLRYNKNKLDIKNKIKNLKFKNIIRLNNNVIWKRKFKDKLLSSNKNMHNINLNTTLKNNGFTSSNKNISYIYKSKIYNSIMKKSRENLILSFNNLNKYKG